MIKNNQFTYSKISGIYMLFAIFCLLFSTSLNQQQINTIGNYIQISNSPSFYSKGICQITFSLKGPSINDMSSLGVTVIVKIQVYNQTVRFIRDLNDVSIYSGDQNNTKIIQPQICTTNNSGSSFCFIYPSDKDNRVSYKSNNSSQFMYKFKLANLICPSKNTNLGNPHLTFYITIINSKTTINLLPDHYIYLNLKHKIIQNILINPVEKKISNQNNTIAPIQANNYLTGCWQWLTIILQIRNDASQNLWQKLQIKFQQFPKALDFDLKSCSKQTTKNNNGTTSQLYGKYSRSMDCIFDQSDNSLYFINPDYIQSSYSSKIVTDKPLPQAIPDVRIKLSIKIRFKNLANYMLYFYVLSNSKTKIDEFGKQSSIKYINPIIYQLYQPKYINIYGKSKQQFIQTQQKTRIYQCLQQYVSKNSLPIPVIIFIIFIIIIVFLGTILFIYDLHKKQQARKNKQHQKQLKQTNIYSDRPFGSNQNN